MSLLYTWYGDDFTGSTDVLEQLAANGVPAVLFLKVPSDADLGIFPDVQAIGIAGDSRSRSPEWMSANLPAIFARLQELGAPVVQYKVCSTFDSSPLVGSIGRAIDLGIAAFNPRFVPVVVGAPHLRRYVFDGNLFAAGPDGTIQRMDRHPMRDHPITPMREPNLCAHLGHQTALRVVGLAYDRLTQAGLEEALAVGAQAVVFDTVSTHDQVQTGALLWREAQERTLFTASSSGLTSALISAWRESGLLPVAAPKRPAVAAQERLLVVSGSCSPMTARQIRWALDRGFYGVRVTPETVAQPETATQLLRALDQDRSVILYTSLGDRDGLGFGEEMGVALGKVLGHCLERSTVERVLLCGGDTSSHAVQQLGLRALTWLATVQPGAPLCQAHGWHRPLQFVLKGGQVGSEDLFGVLREFSQLP